MKSLVAALPSFHLHNPLLALLLLAHDRIPGKVNTLLKLLIADLQEVKRAGIMVGWLGLGLGLKLT